MAKKLTIHSKDGLVHDVIKKFDQRSAVGYNKYKSTLRGDTDTLFRWVNDIQEELMDAILYIQKVKEELTEKGEDRIIENQAKNVMRIYDAEVTIDNPNQISIEEEINDDYVNRFWTQDNT